MRPETVAVWLYFAVDFATFIYLTFFDGYVYTWWNWLIALPANALLAQIWLLGLVPSRILLPLLAAILVVSAAKVWRHAT